MNKFAQFRDPDIHWIKASEKARSYSSDTLPTEQALDRAELLC